MRNIAETNGKIDTRLTQRRSLDVLAKGLARHRQGHPAAHHIYTLIEQCKNFESNPNGLRPLILRTIERIERS